MGSLRWETGSLRSGMGSLRSGHVGPAVARPLLIRCSHPSLCLAHTGPVCSRPDPGAAALLLCLCTSVSFHPARPSRHWTPQCTLGLPLSHRWSHGAGTGRPLACSQHGMCTQKVLSIPMRASAADKALCQEPQGGSGRNCQGATWRRQGLSRTWDRPECCGRGDSGEVRVGGGTERWAMELGLSGPTGRGATWPCPCGLACPSSERWWARA